MPKPIKSKNSPNWQYDFHRGGQRFYGSTGTANPRAAQRFIDRLVAEIAEGKVSKPDITMDQACDAYWLDKGQHERSSKTTEYQLATLCKLLGPNKLLSSIGIKEFRDYIAKRRGTITARKKRLSDASINREWQLARRVWRHVGETHSVSKIDWGTLRLEEPQERVRELKADEEARLFEALPDSLKPVVEFAILSGQRRSAVIHLRWDAIDWRNGEATITNKGGAPHTFPLSPAMIFLLLEQPEVDGCPQVFTYVCERHSPKRKDRPARKRGERYPFTSQGWDRKWRKAMADAGVTDFRFHDLRHTSATRIMRSTGNLKAAGRLLGHSDIRTTSRYAHVGMEDLREIMNVTESRNITGQRLTDPRETRTIPSEKE